MTLVISHATSNDPVLIGDVALSRPGGINEHLQLPLRRTKTQAPSPTSSETIQKLAIIGNFGIGWAGCPSIACSALDSLKTLHDTGHLTGELAHEELLRSSRHTGNAAVSFLVHEIEPRSVKTTCYQSPDTYGTRHQTKFGISIGSGTSILTAAESREGLTRTPVVNLGPDKSPEVQASLDSMVLIARLLAEDYFSPESYDDTFGGLYEAMYPTYVNGVASGFDKLDSVCFAIWPYTRSAGLRISPYAICTIRYKDDILTYEALLDHPDKETTLRTGCVRPSLRTPRDEEVEVGPWLRKQDVNASQFCYAFVDIESGELTFCVGGGAHREWRGIHLQRVEQDSKIVVFVEEGFVDRVERRIIGDTE